MIDGTCAAFATPIGQAGLAVLRISGSDAAIIADQIFCPGVWQQKKSGSAFLNSKTVQNMKGYTCRFGHVFDPDTLELIDQAILTKFVAPNSYTGENVVEISIHGGLAVRNRLLKVVLAAGARAAMAGEFTQRAFLHGKLDLAQAEAVMDIINADADSQAQAAINQLQGKLSQYIAQIREPLLTAMAQLELAIQYPEHEDSIISNLDLQTNIDRVTEQLGELVATYHDGKILKEGLTILLAGRPNAGKSTLLNILTGYSRAIVTNIPGTTRDTLEERIRLHGHIVNLIDTAGLRITDDEVEQLGVKRSVNAMQIADVILWLFPADSTDLDLDIGELNKYSGNATIIPLISKADLLDEIALREFKSNLVKKLDNLTLNNSDGKDFSRITAPMLIAEENKDLLNELTKYIISIYTNMEKLQNSGEMLTSERHFEIVNRAWTLSCQLQSELQVLPLDIVSLTMQNIGEILAEITGESVTDEVWREIFAKFCVGK